jgi:hypothetical protein
MNEKEGEGIKGEERVEMEIGAGSNEKVVGEEYIEKKETTTSTPSEQ